MASPLKINLKITEKDLGLKHIKKEVAKLALKPFVKVGVQGQKALENKLDGDGKSTGVSVVLVATVHEFGAGNIPERSFIRKTVNENQQKYADVASKLKDKILNSKEGFSTEKALNVLGEVVQRDIQNTIRTNNAGLGGPTPLSEATLRRRGVDATPLYDTGQLIRSIRYVREMNGGAPVNDIMEAVKL